jgi:hypothetical protein
MTNPIARDQLDELAPVHADADRESAGWTERLVLLLRALAVLSMSEGLYHWARICGFGAGADGGFEAHALAWQAATVFFAVIDLVASVGLWLAAPWGAVVWLTASVSMVVVHVFFPQIYGVQPFIVLAELALITLYLVIAILAARERPA